MELRGSSHFSSEHTVCSPANSGLRARRFATLHSGSAGLISLAWNFVRHFLLFKFKAHFTYAKWALLNSYRLFINILSRLENTRKLILNNYTYITFLWLVFAAGRVGYCVVAAGYVGCSFKVCDVLIYDTIEQVICEGVALCRYCFDIYFDIACGCDRD